MCYGSRCPPGCPDRDVAPRGVFGNTAHAGEIEHWLTEFGLDAVTLKPSGAIEFFEARSPVRDQPR
jgi:hypothetical protein